MEGEATSQIVATRLYSIDEYLRMEEKSVGKNEYKNGKIINMPGGTIPHNVISINCCAEIRTALKNKKKTCMVASSDMKIHIPAHRFFNYSDGVVICGAPDYFENRRDAIVNPTLIVEVASDSTEVYDRTDKFDEYCTLESFQEYMIVSQKQKRVEVWTKQKEGTWNVQLYKNDADKIKLHSIGCKIDLHEIYFNIDFNITEIAPPQ